MIQLINPYTGLLTAEFETIDQAEARRRITAASQAQKKWSHVPLSRRVESIRSLGERLLAENFSHAQIITESMGKPIVESQAEIKKCADLCSHYATHADQYLAERTIESSYTRSLVRCEALGVVLSIMPWNFPYWQVFRAAVPALLAGNAVVLKHASAATCCAFRMESLITAAGLPEKLFQVLPMRGADCLSVIAMPEIAAVTFTGSNGAGEAVAREAGKHAKKSVLELGGSDPAIVLEDADLEQAVEACVRGRMMNAGQSCIAVKRAIVHQSLHRRFLELASTRIKSIRMGDPMDERTEMGPLSSKESQQEVSRQVQRSVRMGAKIVSGGASTRTTDCFYPPTLLDQVNAEMPVWSEEVFGPVLPVRAFSSEDEAVRMANETPWGLGACIFSRDMDHAVSLGSRIECGTCTINDFVKSDPRVPFGGIKRSGYGRELSEEGIREFCNIKTYNVLEHL